MLFWVVRLKETDIRRPCRHIPSSGAFNGLDGRKRQQLAYFTPLSFMRCSDPPYFRECNKRKPSVVTKKLARFKGILETDGLKLRVTVAAVQQRYNSLWTRFSFCHAGALGALCRINQSARLIHNLHRIRQASRCGWNLCSIFGHGRTSHRRTEAQYEGRWGT